MEGEGTIHQGSWGAVESQAQNLRKASPSSLPWGQPGGQEQHVRDTSIPASPCKEQEIPQGSH